MNIPQARDDPLAPLRGGRIAALFEVVAVVAAGYGALAGLRLLGMRTGAGAFSVVLTLALATWLLDRRGTGWRDIGLCRPVHIGAAAAWALGLCAVDLLLLPALLSMLASALALPAQHLGVFAHVKGDLVSYLVLLIPISWGTAAFGEELLYRGFIMRRLGDALGGARTAQTAAAIGQAVAFALAHAYLGPSGMLNAGVLGLASSVVYRFNGRNLWPLIFAHGLVDSVGITALYLGVAHHG